MKTKKTALLQGVIAVVLCAAMLVGSTLAWFTSGATSNDNIIQSGKLDIELLWTPDLENGPWIDTAKAENDPIFTYDLWEPGYTEVRYFKIQNKGNLAFQYALKIVPNQQVTELADVIDVYYIEDPTENIRSRRDLTGMTPAGVLTDVIDGTASAQGILLPEGETADGLRSGEIIVAVALKMQESAGNEYQGMSIGGTFSVELQAAQYTYEEDTFGDDYDAEAPFPFPENTVSEQVSHAVSVADGKVTTEVTLDGSAVSAVIPAGVAVEEGVTALTLSVSEMDGTGSNVTLGENEELRSLDVHVEGVSADNTVPMTITLRGAAPTGLNEGNLKLYHVENGATNAMTLVSSGEAFTAHNQFQYDPATGDVTLYMATFSEVALTANTENKWNGKYDYSWYTNAVALADGEATTDYIIANADQLAGFGAIVGGMNNQTQDSFTDKTVKLISDVDLGDDEENNVANKIFYPIGYYNSTDSYEKTSGGSVTSSVNPFEGTFDGSGHTISNFYQNTWEMFGDYNNGYSGTPNHYKDAMGLFGYVMNGTVKNLTVDHFSSDGEFTPTGVIAAYAVNAAFENIAITNCNPRVYNTGNGGIIGIAGNSNDEGTKITLKNITVDKTNKISALWGSWDVACGGLVGMFRGNADGGTGEIAFENCHVAAQIDVYNDVCANYQYYAYRYAGMMIGSIRHNTTNDEGKTIPNMAGISASGCTVNYGTWNDYYYCEFEKNTMASYSEDYQFSRVPHSELNFTDSNGNGIIDTVEERGSVTGCTHAHTAAEDKQAVYLPFHQLFTGYSWGVSSIGLEQYSGIVTDLDITEGDQNESVKKFDTKFTGDFLYRVGNQNAVKISSLFAAAPKLDENNNELKDENGNTIYWDINDPGVYVRIDKVYDNADVTCTFTPSSTNWGDGTLKFEGTGVVDIVIQDYDYCEPTTLHLEIVEAENVTTATGATSKKIVLLNNMTFSSSYLYFKNSTLYGNGFTIDISGADHSDLKDVSDTSSNKSAYCNIWMVDSRFDNVRITGSVYPEVGMTADSNYGNAVIRTEGDCYITNSYVSNCRVPVRVQGNTTLKNTVVDGGRYANIELRSGKLTLDGVTTINTVRKGSDGTTDVIGFGIVIHSEAANASISVIGDGLKQYNWVGENKHKNILSSDTYLSNAYKLIFNANNSDTIYFDHNSERYVNTGILCLCADIAKDVVTGLDDRYYQEISGYDAWVLTYDNTKHRDWFDESVEKESVELTPEQESVLPSYSGADAQTVEFTKGETYYFDTSVLKAEKFGQTLEISSVVMNGTTYSYGDKIPLTEGGIYEVIYSVVDPYNFGADGITATTVTHTVTITVTAIAKDAEILAPKFTFIDQNENTYESTTVKAGDKTYVMPNVTAADSTTNNMSSINIGSATISGTTVYFPIATGYTVRSGSNFNRYYPLFNGINITDYTIAGDTTGTTYTTSGDYTSLVGSSGTKFIIPENGGQTNCGDYVKTDDQSGNAAGNSDSGWQGAGYSTSYSGTYLKSGNTNASSGADANGYERIVWVEYCFNAGNGDVYYYRIGYHCNKESVQTGCITPDTLITLADGTQKQIDEISFGDKILTWDFFTGTYVEKDISLLVNHGENTYRVANLQFSDDTLLRLIGEHGMFDYDLNKYVYITADNIQEYIGHRFVKQDLNGGYNIVTLTSGYVTEEFTTAWSITSAGTSNAFASGLLTVAPPDDFYNWIQMDGKLRYDAEQFAADVEEYGLYTYDVFADYVTYEQFVAFNGAYLKIPVEKGLFTFEYILELIDLYAGWMPQ